MAKTNEYFLFPEDDHCFQHVKGRTNTGATVGLKMLKRKLDIPSSHRNAIMPACFRPQPNAHLS